MRSVILAAALVMLAPVAYAQTSAIPPPPPPPAAAPPAPEPMPQSGPPPSPGNEMNEQQNTSVPVGMPTNTAPDPHNCGTPFEPHPCGRTHRR